MSKMMLERMGYTVLAETSPAGALQVGETYSGTVDLLMTDVVMPGMDGNELAAKLALRYPELKCLYMSGYTANVIAHRGMLDSGIHFIQKPFSSKALAMKIRETLAQS